MIGKVRTQPFHSNDENDLQTKVDTFLAEQQLEFHQYRLHYSCSVIPVQGAIAGQMNLMGLYTVFIEYKDVAEEPPQVFQGV